MSKKTRRARANFRAVPKIQASVQATPVVPARPTIAPRIIPAAVKSPANTVKPELYTYLIPDLRNIGIVTAIVLLVLLIAWLMFK
jgi:hypothetical protein